MVADIKKEFIDFTRSTLGLPAPGIASADDYSGLELASVQVLIDYIKTVAGAPPELQRLMQPREMLAGLQSIIIVAVPNFMAGPLDFERCRQELRGALSPLHVSGGLQKRMGDVSAAVINFFKARGRICRPLPPNAPLKIFAARSGIGYYGKNSMIIHPERGSWISLTGYATDAALEPDSPVQGDCGMCTLCLQSCPAEALDPPYRCIMERCLNFQMQSKSAIPGDIRPLLKNNIAYGACRICRDACPRNQKLEPFVDHELSPGMLNPKLLEILDLDEEMWQQGFAGTRMGRIMQDKRYVIRNALIALGNFHDERALDRIARELANSDALIREHAAWALGCIGGAQAAASLKEAYGKEESEAVRREIRAALDRCS